MSIDSDNSKFFSLLSQIREGYFECGMDGIITFCNESFSNLMQLPTGNIHGKHYSGLMSEMDSRELTQLFSRVISTGMPQLLESRDFTTHNGKHLRLDIHVKPISNNKKNFDGYSCLFRDLTGYIQVRDAFLESEQRYFEIIETLPEIVFEIDTSGNIIYVNRKATELLGYSKEELLSLNALDMLEEDGKEKAIRGIREVTRDYRGNGETFNFKKKHGDTLPVKVYITGIYSNEKLVSIRGIAVDIAMLLNSEKALREKEETFRTMVEHSNEIFGVIDTKGILKFESQSAKNVIGYEPEERLGHSAFEYIHPDDRERIFTTFMNSVKEDEKVKVIQYRYRHKNGTWRYLETTGSNLITNPLIKGIILNTRDITEQKHAERSLIKREEKFRSLYNNALVGMITIDWFTGTITESNDLGYKMFGFFSKEEFIGTPAIERFSNDDERLSLNREIKSSGILINREIKMLTKDGSELWVEFSGKNDDDAGDIKAVVVDISKRKRAEEMATYYTFYDQLSGLPNRQMFRNRLKMEIVKSARRGRDHIFCVMCIGIDRFKNINEMHGPVLGDNVLRKVANRLSKSFRQDDIVSRFSGDKFMVLFSEIGKTEGIADIIQKSVAVFSDPLIIESTVLTVTASIGVCIYPNDGSTSEELLKNAETAMYMAKEQGRNTYFLFNAKLNEEILKRLKIEHELQYAIFNNEFIAHYQPKVTRDGVIAGMESLIRWNSPQRGIITPQYFIPMAERNGMIEKIGNIILHESCLQNKKWQDSGYPSVRVSVNLSPYQFRQKNIISIIENVLHNTGLKPEWLELEITESGIMDDEQESIRKIHELNEIGIAISIDDFGTGYSSFSKLKDFPIDTLKIDKSFIDSIAYNNKSATIAKTIIDLAHNLGCVVVAEGVETKEQLDFLVQNNCDLFQGFYFFKPLASHHFEQTLIDKKNS